MLYDLRFLSDSAKVVQQYRPSCFNDLSDVPVSGIDISKDRKELLVSYEGDQIYTFPVLPSRPDPTADDLLDYSNDFLKNSESGSLYNTGINHFAGYGGHLNRFTFLKCAKYAGPNDEYICTGSVSVVSRHKNGSNHLSSDYFFLYFNCSYFYRTRVMLSYTKSTQVLSCLCSKLTSPLAMVLFPIQPYQYLSHMASIPQLNYGGKK